MAQYTAEDLDKITRKVSLVDYFYYLQSKGQVKFDRKSGGDYYFTTEHNKYSVTDNGYYDFKTGKGGKTIKAVMELENKSWKEAVDFLKDFANVTIDSELKKDIAEKRRKLTNESKGTTKIIRSIVPNNQKLIEYFEQRGISKEVLKANTKQVHYEVRGRQYFGIGLENESKGVEIRNPMMKSKIGKNDFTVIGSSKDRMVVFEGMTDMLSFLQLLKDNNKPNNQTLVCLNSVTNIDKFIEKNQDYNGKMFLILDGDEAGNSATKKILESFADKDVKDVRQSYNIQQGGNNDLNDYLKKKLQFNKKSNNLAKNISDENSSRSKTQSKGIPNPKQVGKSTSKQHAESVGSESQSKQEDRGNNSGGQDLFSQNAGNGLTSSEELDVRLQRGTGSDGGNNGEREESVPNEGRTGTTSLKESTNIPELDYLIQKYKEKKLTNEQVTELVSVACFVDENKQVHLNYNLVVTEDLKNLVSQYKTGGIAKQGRGILDEYYTNAEIVDSVKNLINKELGAKDNLSILEPSVGVGNFLNAVTDLPNATINSFEINNTTAKISKILYPNVDVNLRSFETEFITENGRKKADFTYENRYDLVIGNPPYGDHRGFYKGLGEEPKLSKYEDYFVKRSLDTMKQGGVLAMVLPSGWLNRQKKLNNAELINAYRLPVGAFAGTQIGTDIILLKKDSQKQNIDISNYFNENPNKVLGEIREKTNRFGKLEEYVYGKLDEALAFIEKDNLQKKEQNLIQHSTTSKDVSLEDIEKNKTYQEIKRDSFGGVMYNVDNLTKYDEKEVLELLDLWDKINPIIQESVGGITKGIIGFAKDCKEEIQKQNIHTSIDDVQLEKEEAIEKSKEALELLNKVKFKTPAIVKEIDKYKRLTAQLSNEDNSFTKEELEEVKIKAERIIKNQQKKNKTPEYEVQLEPKIKKGVLKYQFSKDDKIVNTSIQNNPKLTQEEIKAFEDTNYDGTLNNKDEFYKYANYIQGNWVHDFYYAEGNIYSKLEQLEQDKHAIDSKQYEKQKDLLESVLPKKKALEDIIISPNHEFIHNFSLGEREVTKMEKNYYNSWEERTVIENFTLADKFKDFVKELPTEAFQGSTWWEVTGFVNNETVTGSDRERNALVRERRKEVANDLFKKFVKEEMTNAEKERFVTEFNRNYNNIHIPNYSNFPLFSKIYHNFKGSPLRLSEVQKAGIGRLTTKGVGALAHEVGFGKTLSGVLSMHEAMERNMAKRPLIVVPNDSILKQWVETIYETIPNAKVNVLGNLGANFDLSNFDNKDNEITIVTYSGFNNIGFSKEVTDQLASKFSYISKDELKSVKNTERDLQKELEKENELKGKMKKGKVYDWEDFGFDHLTFDEVHNANHIVGKVRIEDRRFASDFRSQNQRTSALGINTWMASQYIQENYDGRNVTLLSATPFTNKPLEYYSILSLVANNRLEEKGYFNVNTFFETFMEADNEMEIDAVGDVKYKSNVKRFKNNAIFQQLLGEFIDIKGEEDNPELVRPNRINKEYKIKQNSITQEQYEFLNENYSDVEKGAVLTHILNARLIAISPYLSPYYEGSEPTAKEFIENSPKLKTTIDLVCQNKKDKSSAGQIIYSELAVSEFPKIKEYLVDNADFKDKEVAIITGKTSKTQRQKIQEDFNLGKTKIIIGSSAIQEGMNLQENTSDMYLLSLPYNFTSLRQTEGRAWRQGNKFENVRINYMLTEDSIDVFMLQKLQAKQARYLEAMKKDVNILDVSDINTQELKTALITNPKTRAEIEVKIEEKRLESEKNRLIADASFTFRKLEKVRELKDKIAKYEEKTEWIAKNYAPKSDHYKEDVQKRKLMATRMNNELNLRISQLKEKGIDVLAFEKNAELTDEKIKVIEDKINNLSEWKKELITIYKEEKVKKEKLDNQKYFVQERAEENKSFYNLRSSEKEIETVDISEERPRGFRR